jgi:hypothetical protein
MSSPGRSLAVCFVALLIAFLAACSNSSSAPIAVTLSPASSQAIDQAQTVAISATVANDSKNAGVTWAVAGGGTLSNETTTSATYNAPASVTSSFPVNVTATSASDPSKSATLHITVNPLPTISTQSLPQATAGINYSAIINAAGGTSPFTWSIVSGTLPSGITMGSSTTHSITLSGMPLAASSSSVTFMVADSVGNSSTQALTLTVNPPGPLSVTTTTLAGGVLGASYSQTVTATGGVPAYHWSIISGALPAGLTLNPSSGNISGTPTATGTSGFTIQVIDSETPTPQTATANLSITVTNPPPLQITTTSLPNGNTGAAYSATLSATGGVQPYTWSISTGNLPTGLTLTSGSGQISGTPTATGTFSFTVEVQDSEHPAEQATANLSITIASGTLLQITTASLPEGSEATSYSVTLAATGGASPYTWSVSSGSLPSGLTLNASAGTITGKPTVQGTFNLTLKVTDSASATATAPLSIFVISCNNNGALSGNWAMLLEGYNTAQQPAPLLSAVGSFVTDGSGNIISGSLDTNDQANGPATGTITSGKYCIATNNTGLMTLNQNVGGTSSVHTYAISMNSAGTDGHVVYYDNSAAMASGQLRPQTTSAFSTAQFSGYYAFGLIGADQGGAAAVSRFGAAGMFTADAAGNLAGFADTNADGTVAGNVTLASSNFTVLSSTTGRGTVTIALTGEGNKSFVFYVVNSGELLMMETDAKSSSLLAGRVLAQTLGGVFSNLSLNGNAIVGFQAIDGSGTPAGSVSAGIFNSTGNGSATVSLDQNDAGTEGTVVDNSVTYSVDYTGRVTLTGFGTHPPVFYLVSQNAGFALGTDNSVAFGRLYSQTGSNFNSGSVDGAYLGGSDHPEDANSGSSVALLTSQGMGAIAGLSLTNGGTDPGNNSLSYTYTVSSAGRVVVSQGSTQVGIAYIIDADTLVFMPQGGASSDPTLSWFEQ